MDSLSSFKALSAQASSAGVKSSRAVMGEYARATVKGSDAFAPN